MEDSQIDVQLQLAKEQVKSDSLFIIKLGSTPRDKERDCYSGFIITSDAGRIIGNQLAFPGGKSCKLSTKVRSELAKIGVVEGKVINCMSLCVEQTAWWAEKAKDLLLITFLTPTSSIKILILDHLGKHMDLNWCVALAKHGYILAPEFLQRIDTYESLQTSESKFESKQATDFITNIMNESESISKHIIEKFGVMDLSESGIIKILHKIVPYAQKYCADHVNKKQNKRIMNLDKFFFEIAQANDDNEDDRKFEDISGHLMSIYARHK